MSYFARLFERDGEQLLALKEKDGERLPAIAFRFNTPAGNHCTIHLSFGNSLDRDAAFDAPNLEEMGWDLVEDVNRESGL